MIILGIVIAILVLAISIIYQKRAKRLDGVYCPAHFSTFFGHVPYLQKKLFAGETQELFDWTVDSALASNQKPYQVAIPDKDFVVRFTTPEAAQFILKDQFEKFVKINNEMSKLIGLEFFGNGIFTADGDDWRFERKVASHMFSTHLLDNVMSPIFLEHGETVLGILKECAKKDEVFDIQDLMKRYTMDSICKIAFGVHFNSLTKPSCDFSKAFDRIQEIIVFRTLKPEFMFHLDKLMKWNGEKELAEDATTLNDTVHQIIHQRNEKFEKGEINESSRWDDLLSQFILMKKKKGEKLDPKQTRDIVMNFLIAGRDTTACLLTWSFYELGKHPEIEEKIFQEMKETFRENPISPESVKDLKYTQNFLSEILRLHPPVPFDEKKAVEDITFPDGTFIPKDTICQYSPYIFGRMPYLWENPNEIIPERWEKDPNPSEFKFLTFNAGPRLCLGKRMAYLEVKILLSLILSEYEIIVEPRESFQPVAGIIMWVKDGLQVRAQSRSSL